MAVFKFRAGWVEEEPSGPQDWGPGLGKSRGADRRVNLDQEFSVCGGVGPTWVSAGEKLSVTWWASFLCPPPHHRAGPTLWPLIIGPLIFFCFFCCDDNI